MQINLQQAQLNETEQSQPMPLFRLAFRPFFLLGSLFGVVAVGLWIMTLSGWINLSFYGGGVWWHSHEMLFGFVVAIVVGFLLTAVQNWSGIPGVNGGALMSLVSIWLAARILLLVDIGLSPWVLAIIDTVFMPVAAIFLALPILKKKLYRNLFFIPLLFLMSAANFLMHWALISGDYQLINKSSYAMVMLVTFLICVMGGRVIPMFTANGTRTTKVEPIGWLEKVSIVSIALVALVFISGVNLPNSVMGALTFIAAFIHLTRCLRWRFWVTLKTPLVWSLHMSYFCIPFGLFLLSIHYWFAMIGFSSALHMLTVGGMATMILAMISRVSLGHTGRMIVVGHLMGTAFVSLVMAALVRSLLPLVIDDYILVLIISSACWMVGFGLFFVKYYSVLTQARVDGRPG